jgi:hypothetical protein
MSLAIKLDRILSITPRSLRRQCGGVSSESGSAMPITSTCVETSQLVEVIATAG